MPVKSGTYPSGLRPSPLGDVLSGVLDPAYAQAAARRQGADTGRPRPAAVVFVALLVLGVLTGIASGQVRRSDTAAAGVRKSLVREVGQRTRDTERLTSTAAARRIDVARLRDRALGTDSTGRAAAAQLSALELATGQVPVKGPGVVVTLDDAPSPVDSSQPRGTRASDGRVYDRDLQDAVNALWAAGGEAISVNGQRLTSLTAIRSAGEAILVDLRPLSPPYVLRVVGDPGAVEPAFADSPAARRFSTYSSLYGIGFDVRRADSLALPAAAAPDLRLAVPVGAR